MNSQKKRRFRRWLQPGIGIKRWLLLFAAGVILAALGLTFSWNSRFIGILEESLFFMLYQWTGSYVYMASTFFGLGAVAIGIIAMFYATRRMIAAVATALEPDGALGIMDVIYERRKLETGPHIVALGGGTGLSVLLRGIKEYTSNISAIVTVADDGGSSGRLREGMGIVPPGDIRNCLVALADTEPIMESLFQYRFQGESGLAGHSLGNLFIAAMIEVAGGDIEKALVQANKILRVQGKVIPSTHTSVRLSAVLENGAFVTGESKIGHSPCPIKEVKIEPSDVTAPDEAIRALKRADVILLGPGSLFTSIIPNLLVPGIVATIRESTAPVIYICNVMTQPGETDHLTALAHLKALQQYIGDNVIDIIVVNNGVPSDELLARYLEEGAEPVLVEKEEIESLGVRVIEADLISVEDLVRHDSEKLSKLIRRLVGQVKNWRRG